MDKEFGYLAVICTVTLLLGVFSFLSVIEMPVDADYAWEVCESPNTPNQRRDCELYQALVDANLMEAG